MARLLNRLCAVAACALAALPWPAAANVFYPSSFTLANGLQVVVVPNHSAPVVSQMVWYKVGAADEVPGKNGLAHYLEHLMFRGTKTVPPDEFSKIIAAQGGQDNAFTAYDYTAFFEEVAADRLALIMQMEADRMQNLDIRPETAGPELRVVLSERQQRTDNDPEGRFIEKLDDKFMPHYAYGRPVIGWKREIERLTPEDARAFYQKYYAPNNAVVIVSGDVTVEEAMRLSAATYGRVPEHAVPPRRALGRAPEPAARDVAVKDSGIEQPTLIWRLVAPSYATQKDGEAYAYEVLAEALGGGEVGVLYRKLVSEENLASGVDVSYDPDARGETSFTIVASPRAVAMTAKVRLALRAAVREAAADGLSAAEVEEAKARLKRSAIFAREGVMMPGYAFGMALTTGHAVADVEAWPERIDVVTVDQVNAVLRALAGSSRECLGVLMPSGGKAAHGGARPFGGLGTNVR